MHNMLPKSIFMFAFVVLYARHEICCCRVGGDYSGYALRP